MVASMHTNGHGPADKEQQHSVPRAKRHETYDGAYAVRLMLSCAALGLVLWLILPSCASTRARVLLQRIGSAWEVMPAEGNATVHATGKVPRKIHQAFHKPAVPEALLRLQVGIRQSSPLAWGTLTGARRGGLTR